MGHGATKPAYSVLKNNLLYAMIFLMLLRCDIRKIIKLGPKMLGGFFAASVSISVAFIATFAIMKGPLAPKHGRHWALCAAAGWALRQHDRRAGCAGHRRS